MTGEGIVYLVFVALGFVCAAGKLLRTSLDGTGLKSVFNCCAVLMAGIAIFLASPA